MVGGPRPGGGGKQLRGGPPPLFPGQIDEDDVRVLAHPVEDDLPAVRRNVKASDRIPWLKIGELPALPRLQIDDPEILLEITAEQHDELPATRQKTVTIASSRYYYLGR